MRARQVGMLLQYMGGVARLRRFVIAIVVSVMLVAAGTALHRRLLCAGLFLRLEQSAGPAWLLHYRERPVDTRELTFAGGQGRLYWPRGEGAPPGLVLAHGMHEDGIRDPRMVGFATALAGAGIAVLTPEVTGLAHYQITHDDVVRIAASARALAGLVARPTVTVFGISFGGGLALRAACEPAQRDAIARVVALGAHHDALRVSRFFLGEPALGPGGERADVTPHPYSLRALFLSLFAEARKGALSEVERARAQAGLRAREADLAAASPSGCPEPVRVPVRLVHGTGDRVVPFTESLWNARQLAGQTDVDALISPAIAHAEYAPPSWWDRLALVEFIVGALF